MRLSYKDQQFHSDHDGLSFIQREALSELDSQIKELANASRPKTLQTTPSNASIEVNYDANSTLSDLSSISTLQGPIEDIYRKRKLTSSRYRLNRTRIEPTLLNHFLDFLSMCFWKCSPGCQQIPETPAL